MKARFKVTSKDKGFAKLSVEFKALARGDTYVKAGVLGDAEHTGGDGITNVELAVIHEFGSPSNNIPERSFIRSTFEANKAFYQAALRAGINRVMDGQGSFARMLGMLGAKMAADMKKTIVAGIDPPTSPATTARKLAKSYAGAAAGDPKPLIDTGQLLSSITWEVVDSGTKKGK